MDGEVRGRGVDGEVRGGGGHVCMFSVHVKMTIPSSSQALGLPLYWRAALYKACGGKARKTISFPMLKRSWLRYADHSPCFVLQNL